MGNHTEILRFPRISPGYTLEKAPVVLNKHGKLSRTGQYILRTLHGDTPMGYDRLKKRHKRVAKLVASGMTIQAACEETHTTLATFFRWRRSHAPFREYLNKQIVKNLADVDARLERQVVRASQVVDEALDSEDPYFATSVAKDVLKGRGRWSSSSHSTVQQNLSGKVAVEAEVTDHGMSADIVKMLVDGFVKMAAGKPIDERVIDIEPEHVKALPPAEGSEGTVT